MWPSPQKCSTRLAQLVQTSLSCPACVPHGGDLQGPLPPLQNPEDQLFSCSSHDGCQKEANQRTVRLKPLPIPKPFCKDAQNVNECRGPQKPQKSAACFPVFSLLFVCLFVWLLLLSFVVVVFCCFVVLLLFGCCWFVVVGLLLLLVCCCWFVVVVVVGLLLLLVCCCCCCWCCCCFIVVFLLLLRLFVCLVVSFFAPEHPKEKTTYQAIPAHDRKTSSLDSIALCSGGPGACCAIAAIQG